MTASTRIRAVRHLTAVISGLLLVVAVVACDTPADIGPVDMDDVTAHLDVVIGYIPAGCDPAGLDGDGRGTIVGAGFECVDGTAMHIERFDAQVDDDPLSDTPSETTSGRIEWRDSATGDVIRVTSADIDVEVLVRIAESIEVRET